MAKEALEKAVERFKNGDASAFEHIYESTYKLVFFVAYGIVKSKEVAEDVVQETYLKAFRFIGSYKSDNIVAWLTTIAKRIAINEYNKGKRSTATDFDSLEAVIGKDGMPDEDSFGLIDKASRLLDETDYKIVIMCAVSGYKRREVASLLDMPISTVSYRYTVALKTLRKSIEGGSKK